MEIVLSIAGSDPCAGAGIQGDLKTFLAFNVYGMSVITALTSQNSIGVKSVYPVPSEVLKEQLDILSQDFKFDAIKIGMLYTLENAVVVKNFIKDKRNIVLDPIIYSSNRVRLINKETLEFMKNELFPIVTIITPNYLEAAIISGVEINNIEDVKIAAKSIRKRFRAKNILIKGGESGIDILYNGYDFKLYESDRLDIENVHGTGCALSSAIASGLAKGLSIKESVKEAKQYITIFIKNSIKIGKGVNLLNHLKYMK